MYIIMTVLNDIQPKYSFERLIIPGISAITCLDRGLRADVPYSSPVKLSWSEETVSPPYISRMKLHFFDHIILVLYVVIWFQMMDHWWPTMLKYVIIYKLFFARRSRRPCNSSTILNLPLCTFLIEVVSYNCRSVSSFLLPPHCCNQFNGMWSKKLAAFRRFRHRPPFNVALQITGPTRRCSKMPIQTINPKRCWGLLPLFAVESALPNSVYFY